MAWGERLKAHWNVYSRVDAFIFISVFGHCVIHFPVICAPPSGPHSVLQRRSERSEEQGQKENIKSKIIKRFSSSLNNYGRVGYSKYDTYHDERLSLLQFDCPHITPIFRKAPFSHHPLAQILYRVRILSVPVVLEHFQRSPPIRIQANDEILLAPNSPREDSPSLKSRTLHMIAT